MLGWRSAHCRAVSRNRTESIVEAAVQSSTPARIPSPASPSGRKNGRIEMFTRLSKIAAVLSGVTASLMITTSANAQRTPVVVYGHEEADVRTERVSYADLNLAASAGERKLVRRVSDAVKRVCLYRDGTIGLQSNGYTICADGAWDSANPQIAQAVQRAKDIALTGKSSIAAAAISISVR
jgi:UrcA family protein